MDSRANDTVDRVAYEWRMFAEAYRRIVEHQEAGWPDWFTKYSVMETFLLHTRILRDFLFKNDGNKRNPDDVLAVDFFNQPQDWSETRPSLGSYLSAERQYHRLNKALSHLSYERINYEKTGKAWDIGAIWKEIGEVWNEFLKALPAEQRGWFGKYAERRGFSITAEINQIDL